MLTGRMVEYLRRPSMKASPLPRTALEVGFSLDHLLHPCPQVRGVRCVNAALRSRLLEVWRRVASLENRASTFFVGSRLPPMQCGRQRVTIIPRVSQRNLRGLTPFPHNINSRSSPEIAKGRLATCRGCEVRLGALPNPESNRSEGLSLKAFPEPTAGITQVPCHARFSFRNCLHCVSSRYTLYNPFPLILKDPPSCCYTGGGRLE